MGLTAIGINIYGGGFTLGVMNHFEVLGQWEECKLGMKTFDMNFRNIYRPLSMSQWPIEAYSGAVDLVYANPPCVPWSTSTGLKGATVHNRQFDKRLDLTVHTMEAAIELKPKVFISESVENGYNIGKGYYERYKEMWMGEGYSVTYFLNDAIIQGAPCVRRRFHFIAHKDKLQLREKPIIDRINTVKDAIGDLLEVNDSIKHHSHKNHRPYIVPVMHKIPEYGLVRCTLEILDDYTGGKVGFCSRKLAWEYPAPTMVGFEFVHAKLDRWITYREALRLCTYPDSFNIYLPIEAIDAVLPIVGDFLASTAKKTILKAEPQEQQFEIIDWRPFGKPFHFNKHATNKRIQLDQAMGL